MKAAIAVLLSCCVSLPIAYYLQYRILELVGATPLMWFLYWAAVPVGVLVTVLAKLAENDS